MAKKTTAAGDIAGGITQAQLDEWKKNNTEGVHTLNILIKEAQYENKLDAKGQVELDDNKEVVKIEIKPAEVLTIYVKDPFNDPEIVAEAQAKKSTSEMQDFLLAACLLGGDTKEVLANRKVRYWAARECMKLIEFYEVEVKKS